MFHYRKNLFVFEINFDYFLMYIKHDRHHFVLILDIKHRIFHHDILQNQEKNKM